jgi:hypothetical protein
MAATVPAICQSTDKYIAPTPAQIMAYWNKLTPDQRVAEILKLDVIEHTSPIITGLQLAAVLDTNGDLIMWFTDTVKIKIASLDYKLDMAPQTIKGFYQVQEKSFWPFLVTVFGTTLLATGATVIGGGKESWQYILSGSFGLAMGIFLDIFWTLPF